jgi:hypothetical protein
VVARWRHAQDAQDQGKGKGELRAGDRAQDAGLALALGQTLACEAKSRHPDDREEKPHGGRQYPSSLVQFRDGGEELLAVLPECFEGHHGAQATTPPGGDGRARDVQAVAQRPRTGATHMLSEAMVVHAAVLGGRGKLCRHRGRIAERDFRSSGSSAESSVISNMPQLRTRLFGMSCLSAPTRRKDTSAGLTKTNRHS